MLAAAVPSQITTTFTFFGHIPSKKNSLRRIARGNRVLTIPSLAHEEWERQELATLINAPKLYPPYEISIVVYPGTLRACDLSNQLESCNDVLVKAGVLEDDNWFAIQSLSTCLGGLDVENPRTEYTVKSSRRRNTIAAIKEEFEIESKVQRKLLKAKQRIKN